MLVEQYNCTKIYFCHDNGGKRSTIFPTGIESEMPDELKGIMLEKDWDSYCFRIEKVLQPIQAAEREARIGKTWCCVTILLIATGISIYLGVEQNDITYETDSFLFSVAMYVGVGAVVLITLCCWWICYNSS